MTELPKSVHQQAPQLPYRLNYSAHVSIDEKTEGHQQAYIDQGDQDNKEAASGDLSSDNSSEQFFDTQQTNEHSTDNWGTSSHTQHHQRAISPIDGISYDDPLFKGVVLATEAVSLFLDSDFEKIETLLNKRRHSLLYASEGYAAIQTMRAMMAFTREAMSDAQLATEATINLAMHFRKPRGMGALLSGTPSKTPSRSDVSSDLPPSKGSKTPYYNTNEDSSVSHSRASPMSDITSVSTDTTGGGINGHSKKSGEGRRRFRLDSPKLSLHRRKTKTKDKQPKHDSLGNVAGSQTSLAAGYNASDEQPANETKRANKYGSSRSNSSPELFSGNVYTDISSMNNAAADADEPLDTPSTRSWASGLTGMADSLIGIVRAGTQAVGISKPEWHALKAMTPIQRHAELIHAEAYLLRAVLNIAMGDGVMAFLKEGWHVRSAYHTYRGCYAYIQDLYKEGGRADDHFVSGTYLGMGVFNLLLSMLPSKLLRFVELVGFSADRNFGLELLAIASGWRADPLINDLLGPPLKSSNPTNKPSADAHSEIHPCGNGLRSDFCALALLSYHVVLCNELYIGYSNHSLVDTVLRRSITEHPNGLMFLYFCGRNHVIRSDLNDAIMSYNILIRRAKGNDNPDSGKRNEKITIDKKDNPDGNNLEDATDFIEKLCAQGLADAKSKNNTGSQTSEPASDASSSSKSDWLQLQYLGYWERSICLMGLGKWLDAAQSFNILRTENNWNKAVYTYALGACIWEHYFSLYDGAVPTNTGHINDTHKKTLALVKEIMGKVSTLKRKVAGKSLPIEKFVIRKARKFHEQGDFLMRPGLELLHIWGFYAKTPHNRLSSLRNEIDRDIAHMSEFAPTQRAPENPYRHIFYYDDLALLLLVKGCVIREIAYPSYLYDGPATEKSKPKPNITTVDTTSDTMRLGSIAEDTFLRLLRLMPLINRDHYLIPSARFYLGNLYLAIDFEDKKRQFWARAQWRCILDGTPLSSPPCLSSEEYNAIICDVLEPVQDSKHANNDQMIAAPTCLTEEMILESTGHTSLTFFDNGFSVNEWRWLPPYWADSKKYSLQNILEVRTFNADTRLLDALSSSKKQ